MELKLKAKEYLRNLAYNKTAFFFDSIPSPRALVGSISGRLICLMIIEDENISSQESNFCSKIRNSGGEAFTIYSLEDLCELAKTRGWHD